mmetsp:Transcript_7458/g.17835  ORF Transcript_7458/g.17835 Transcript_7458/m.17835 type:complete len:248 (+) Transcript_7458:1190-1933(+)
METQREPPIWEMCRLPFSLLGGLKRYMNRSQNDPSDGLEQVSRTAMRPASRCMRWFQVSSHLFWYEQPSSPNLIRYSMAWPSTQSTNSSSPNSNLAGPACTRCPRSHAGTFPSTFRLSTFSSSFADCSQFLKSMPTWYVPSGPAEGSMLVTSFSVTAFLAAADCRSARQATRCLCWRLPAAAVAAAAAATLAKGAKGARPGLWLVPATRPGAWACRGPATTKASWPAGRARLLAAMARPFLRPEIRL